MLDDFGRDDLIFDTARVDHVCEFISNLVHIKGKWAGTPIKLEPFQVFVLANLFGFLDKSTGLRRYREAFILLPRKNGKSLLAAGIALYMTFADGEPGAEGYSGATSLEQANEVFLPAKRMVELAPGLADALDIEASARSVYSETTGASFKPVIARTKDGSSPHVAICDELHQAIDATQIEAFRTGMGARSQPLLLVISTAGVNLAGVCRAQQSYCEAVLDGSITDDRTFVLIYTIDLGDDWREFAVWAKANPNIGVSISEEYLRDQHSKALQSPANQASARTKHLNQWVSSASGWLNQADWANAADTAISYEALKGRPATIGVDLSTMLDLTAVLATVTLEDGRKALLPWLYVPRGSIERSKNAPAYAQWIDSGDLIGSDGETINLREIQDQIEALCDHFAVTDIIFDPRDAQQMQQELIEAGYSVSTFAQNATNYTPAMVDFEAALVDGKIIHPNNAAFNWCAANISVQHGRNDSLFPQKPTGQDHLKIDGMIAALMAFASSNVAAVVESEPQIRWL